MGRNKFPLFIYIIVGLAIVGLVSSLMKNPGSFFVSIFIAVGVGFVIFMIFTYILKRRGHGTSDEMKKYRKAAKQSNLKYGKQQPKVKKTTRTTSPLKPKRKRRPITHLTVIDGKKTNKNDDRASN